jgi:hypothetical protein
MLNIADPDFQWSNFTRSVYVDHKQAAGLAKQVSSDMTPGEKSAAPSVAASAFDFSAEVLATDANCQAAPVSPGTVTTLKPHKLWKSPFAANTRKGHTRQLHSTVRKSMHRRACTLEPACAALDTKDIDYIL